MIHCLQHHYFNADPVDPATLSTGADGGLYLANDLSFLRSDQWDTPAAVGSPVCMIFDRWVANTLGSDLVTNGSFATTTTGWTAASSTLSVVSARGRVTNSGAAVGRGWQQITTVVGATYKCTFDLVTNADGAAFCVGTSNSTSTLANQVFAGGTTGTGLVVYFIATTTTSFIQLRTNVATSGKLTDWDNVTCKLFAGRNLIQQTSASAPILRQDALGNYYLEKSATQFIAGGFSYTIGMPNYLVACVQREDGGAAAMTPFGVFKNSGNYHALRSTSVQRVIGSARNSTLGDTVTTSPSSRWGNTRTISLDSLAVTAVVDSCSQRFPPTILTSPWGSSDTLTLCAPGIGTATGTTADGQASNIYGACAMAQDPGANRAGLRAYFANLAGAD